MERCRLDDGVRNEFEHGVEIELESVCYSLHTILNLWHATLYNGRLPQIFLRICGDNLRPGIVFAFLGIASVW